MTISVDDNFVRFGSKSYAINKINTVEVRERQPHGKGGAWFCVGVAVLFLMGGLGSFANPGGASIFSFIVAAVFGFIAYVLFERAKNREFQLFLMTSSSESQAFVTSDESEITSLRDQIEAAMIRPARVGAGD